MNEVYIAIDTSHQQGVLAVFHPEKGILFESIAREKMSHGVNLPLFFERALDFIAQNNLVLVGVGVGLGPGSFVGIRISLSLALGFCFARTIPLMGFCSHKALHHSLLGAHKTVDFVMKASGNLVYFSSFEGENSSLKLVGIEEVELDKANVFSDIENIGNKIEGPTPAGIQHAFMARLKENGIVDESEFIKPNYVKNPSVSLKGSMG